MACFSPIFGLCGLIGVNDALKFRGVWPYRQPSVRPYRQPSFRPYRDAPCNAYVLRTPRIYNICGFICGKGMKKWTGEDFGSDNNSLKYQISQTNSISNDLRTFLLWLKIEHISRFESAAIFSNWEAELRLLSSKTFASRPLINSRSSMLFEVLLKNFE